MRAGRAEQPQEVSSRMCARVKKSKTHNWFRLQLSGDAAPHMQDKLPFYHLGNSLMNNDRECVQQPPEVSSSVSDLIRL